MVSKPPAGAVDGRRGERRARCGPAAGSSRCPRGRRRTCSPGPGRRPAWTWSTPSDGEQALRPVGEQGDLVAGRARRTGRERRRRPRRRRRGPARRPARPAPARPGPACGPPGRPARRSAAARSGVRSPWEAKPQTPSTSTRTASPTTVSSATPVTAAVAQRDRLGDDAFDADVGVLGAAFSGPVERGVGEGGERQRAELRVDPVEHGFNLERDPDARPPAPIKGDAPHPSPRSHDGESRLSSRRVAHFIAAAAASNCRGSGCAAVWADSADGADRGGRSGRAVGACGLRRGGSGRGGAATSGRRADPCG